MPITTEAIGLVGVSKAYPGVKALDQVTFSVAHGSVHGFLGPNGAGKSTTMNIITGLLRESAGAVRINGVECSPLERKKMIGYLPEQPPIYPHMKVTEYLNFVAAIHGVNKTDSANKIEKAMHACGLEQVKNRMIGNLSKGFKQRVGIAQTLVFGAEILILDEPTVGLDPVSVGEIRELIKCLKGHHTVLLSSHLLHEISLICDDITMINHGQVVATGTLQEIETRFASGARFRLRAREFSSAIQEKLMQNFALTITSHSEGWVLHAHNNTQAEAILQCLVEANLGVKEFYQERTELEDVFKVAMQEGARL